MSNINEAFNKTISGGLSGASAMFIQVGSLMWLRTTINYQYRYGTTTKDTIQKLYSEGGILRFYRGVAPALIQGPLSRFGDTAANVGILHLLDNNETTKNLPISVKTICSSGAAGLFRIGLMPVDTCKTILQVEGKDGLKILSNKIKKRGPSVLFHGAIGSSTATFVGHYPWFFTYNYLNETIPEYESVGKNLLRNGLIGFTSSSVSDCVSNSLRVIKTTKQTFDKPISYNEVVTYIVKTDGVIGLFGRGLKTRIITNGLQGFMFSILWKYFQKFYNV